MEELIHKKIIRIIKICFISLLGIMLVSSHLSGSANANVPGKTYYVSPNGSDSNNGTIDQPWKTIQYAVNKVQAGDTLYVRGGEYKENITIKASGSSINGYITIQAYPGETPIIDGEGNKSSSLVQFYGAHYVIFDGFELTNFIVSDSTKYISAIKIIESSSNIRIQNNHIHHIEHRGSKANANGIIVFGNSKKEITKINISNNHLHDLILGSSESITVVGNVDGFTIENNVIERVNNIGIDIAGFYNTCPTGCVDQARNGIVAGNQVSYVDTVTNPAYRGYRAAAGIYVDGGRDTIIERNVVSNSNYGIEVASEKLNSVASGVVVRNNYIHHNHMSGLIMGGSSTSNGGASNNYILNNTFHSNNELRTGDGEITFQHNVKNNVFANNLFETNSETPYFYDNKSTNKGNIIDYNLYHASDNKLQSYWRLGGVRYMTLEQVQEATKQELNSLVDDPKLQFMENGELSLDFSSPAIDFGTLTYKKIGLLDLTAMDRVVGESVDIGAIEYADIEEKPIENMPPIQTEPDDTETELEYLFKIDGLSSDWDQYPALVEGNSNVKEIKATLSNNMLYVLVTGQLLKEKGQLYINSLNSSHHYFEVPYWTTQKADYLLENGILYKYTGSGKDWAWTKTADYRQNQAAITNTAVELAIPLFHLNSQEQSQILIGYIWKDSKVNQLPIAGEMLSVVEKENDQPVTSPSETPAPSETPVPTILPDQEAKPPIAIDGKLDDWNQINIFSDNKDSSLKAYLFNDLEHLYIAITSKSSIQKNQIYINSDNDSKSGYQSSKWKASSGIDYMIENGILYRYAGDGKEWKFSRVYHLDKTAYNNQAGTIELRVKLSDLGINPGNDISLGFLFNDNNSLKLPESDTFLAYQITE